MASASASDSSESEAPLILPAEIRRFTIAAALLLIGMAMAFGERTGERWIAPLFLLGGGALLAWQGSLILRRWQAERARQRMEAEKAALRRARRERVLRERERRQTERAAKAETAKRLAETRARQHQATAQMTQEAALQRAGQERLVLAETERLLGLTDAELWTEVFELFLRRSQRPEVPAPEADCDLLLMSQNGKSREVSRCVPVGRQAGAMDMQALEAWRQDAEATHAYLFAPTGFTPGAIRLSQSLPITLVEAHLLAHWKVHRHD